MNLPRIPCIMGPTGAGKTAAAIALAQHFPVTVINADSRQVYRDFPLITAQPSPEERKACPHRLYGFLETTEKISAGEYARMATAAITEELAQERLPILVGGTGLYLKTLFEGIAPIPPVPAETAAHWQARCDAEGSQALHAFLHTIDAPYAGKIHPNDRQRITRALEVWQATGNTLTWWHRQSTPSPLFTPINIGIMLPLAQLEPLLKKRIDLMMEYGAYEEAKAALLHCAQANAPGWSGIGCRELFDYINKSLTLDEALALWLKQTRAYAKRQITWFKRDTTITWFAPHQTEAIVAHVTAALSAQPGK